MEHRILVEIIDGAADLLKDLDSPGDGELLFVAIFVDGLSIDVLHHIPGHSVRRVAAIEDARNVRMIERRQDPADRRIHALHLTDTGHELLDRAIAIAVAYEQELCGDLSSQEREQLLELLQRVSRRLGLAPGVHAAQGSDEPAEE